MDGSWEEFLGYEDVTGVHALEGFLGLMNGPLRLMIPLKSTRRAIEVGKDLQRWSVYRKGDRIDQRVVIQAPDGLELLRRLGHETEAVLGSLTRARSLANLLGGKL